MGTTWAVKFVQPASHIDEVKVRQQVVNRLEQLEQHFSTYRADSEISRFNASGTTEWFNVSADVVRVADMARQVSELTGGAFDVTVAPLLALWGFGPQRRSGVAPREEEVARARQGVDWRRLETRVAPPAMRKSVRSVSVDLSSISKGYAADQLSELLSSVGTDRHFVQIGGDVKAVGLGPVDERGWRTGIEEPKAQAEGSGLACVVELAGEALSTSGDYRNFVVLDGERYGHIIDPRTGRPADTGLAAVSVVHSSCAWSSALATALFVMGLDEGWRLAEQEKLAVAFFVRDGGAFVRRQTPEFAGRTTGSGR